MKKYVISLDAGKYALKSIGRPAEGTADDIKKVSFRTKMDVMKNNTSDVEGNSYKVTLNGESYIVGDQGRDDKEKYQTSKTTLLHQLCAYTAITQFLEPDTTDNIVYMVLACPLSVLKSDSGKEEYRSFIKGNGPISLTVNDKDYTFEIADVTIKAEGSGVLYLNPELFEKKSVALIDFGGLNMNFCLYENGAAVPSSRFTEEHGSNALTNCVIDQLTIYKKGNIVSFEVAEKALEEGHLNKFGQIDKESVEYIEKAKEIFFNEALKFVAQRKYNLEETAVVFVGGTADKLQDIIRKDLPHAYIPSNSQWSTAEGLYKVACAKYARK